VEVKAAWVRPGGGAVPDGDKAKRYGIDTLYWDATDPQISVEFFDKVRSWGFKPGITRDPGWTGGDGVKLATVLNDDLKRLGSDNKTCYVIADIEAMWQRGSGFVLNWLTEWRRLRPTRITAWTTEPFQGGTVSDELAARINSDPNLTVIPQLYFSQMEPANEAACALEMCQTSGRRDIDRARIKSYYDPRFLPPAWDGIVFDFAKLP
jgi:hypothetical protein